MVVVSGSEFWCWQGALLRIPDMVSGRLQTLCDSHSQGCHRLIHFPCSVLLLFCMLVFAVPKCWVDFFSIAAFGVAVRPQGLLGQSLQK